MKKNQKKGKYLLGLLLGAVALGVGYAAVSNITLNIAGSAQAVGSATDSDFVVRFVQNSDVSSSVAQIASIAANPASYSITTGENVEASASVTDDNTATFSVDKMVEGDEVVFTYYVTNLSSGLSANVTPVITNNYSENFEVTMTPAAGSVFNLDEEEVKEINVTVRCTAQELLDTEGTFTISFTAVATE